jgi:putative ABC transport system permease protein
LFRQLLTESVVLSVLGGALGVGLAFGLTKTIRLLMPDFNVPNEARIEVNGYVLLFSAGVAVITGILFGLMPALKCSRPDLVDALKDAGRSLAGGGQAGRTRAALVIAEIALSVALLMGASLTIRGFLQLQSMDVGFQADRVLMVGLQVAPKRYSTYEQRIALSERVLDSVRGLPGVESAAIGNGGLPFGGPRSGYSIEGQPKEDSRTLVVGLISAEYPQTMGIALRVGRPLTPAEVAHAAPVALINETAAKLWAAGTSPLGRRVRLDLLDKPGNSVLVPSSTTSTVTVVGIIGDTRNDGLRNPTLPAAFLPYTTIAPTGRTLAVRTRTPPMSLLNAVREQVRGIDKDQPLNRPLTLEDIVGTETVQPRFNMALFAFFGLLGLAMAAAGIYSMLSYTVARRTHEIGIRMALGAGRREVLALVLSTGGKLVLAGLGVGLAGSVALAKILRSEVFQVPETDPLALAGAVLLLCAAALLACLLPARRAARLDPVSALRHE